MIYETGHSNTSLSNWKTFVEEAPPRLIDVVVDRSEVGLPEWFTPLARGIAIASDHLLKQAGYRPGSRRPPGWEPIGQDVFRRLEPWGNALLVRGCSRWWTVEYHPYDWPEKVLVFRFGSTPLFTRSYQSAMWLADYCYPKPQPGLCWIDECPPDREAKIAFARARACRGAGCACGGWLKPCRVRRG
jgi:hypothetical protein